MKHRMDLRTKMNHTAHDANLSHIKQHVAKLKAFHAGCKDYNFGTARKWSLTNKHLVNRPQTTHLSLRLTWRLQTVPRALYIITSELVREAEEYWKERDRREEEEARKKEMLPLTMSELYLPDMDENEDVCLFTQITSLDDVVMISVLKF